MAEFKLGRIKFVWKGVWQTSDTYYKDDVISYGGNTYICVLGHTSSSSFDTDLSSKWERMSGGTDWKGTWTNAVVYKQGDIVSYFANTYICIAGHTANHSGGVEPPNGAYWEVYTNGVDWKGDWATSTVYRVNDLVKHNSNVYICITQHTSSGTFDFSKFNAFILGLEFDDSWNSSTTYDIGSVVTYGGYSYVAATTNSNSTPSTSSSDWDLLTTGFKPQGSWSSVTSYKTGDVVQFGGWAYVSIVDSVNQRPYIGTSGINSSYWNLVVKGLATKGAYNNSTLYAPGDIVEQSGTSYVAIATVSGNVPPNGTYWQVLSQGSIGASLSARGDIAYREYSGAVVGLHMNDGTYLGTSVKEGYVLKARSILSPTAGLEPRWEEFGHTNNVWYVSPAGTDNVDAGYGRTLDRPFATIKYACTQATSGSTIFIKTGTYAEQLPIRVPPGVSLVGDEVRTTTVTPASGTSDDSITPNNRSRMFLVNNASTIRNLTLSGLTGSFTASDSPTGSSVLRLNMNWPSASASGCYISLDPTGNISSRSPYIQNCSNIGTRCIGVLIDGNAQAGGYKSMVMNDFTQVLDDGIGVWATNGGRAELVSVFTYYNYIGYLSELGGVLRALNGNNSYGTYGSIAVDIDPSDSGYSGIVNNRSNQATVGKVWVGEGRVLAVGWNYQGQSYSAATLTLDSAPLTGTNASVTPVIDNGVLSHVTVASSGSGYQYVTGTGRAGGSSVSGVWFALAATDKMATANQYLGMRITILDGTGSGQTGIIKSSLLIDAVSGYNKVVYVQTSAGVDGWETLTGDVIKTSLDASTQYDILPEIKAIGGTPTRTAKLKAKVDPSTFTLTGVYILDGGSGYSDSPKYSLTDPTSYDSGLFNARRLIVANKQFLKDEVTAFMSSNYVNLWNSLSATNKANCIRDIGYIVDALQYDLTYGGNLETIVAARSYYSNGVFVEASNEKVAALAVQARIKDIIDNIVLGDSSGWSRSTGNGTTQYISGTPGTSGAAAFVQARIQEIYDAIDTGTTPSTVTPSSAWVSASLLTAFNNVQAQKATIQSQAVSWVQANYPSLSFNSATCSRDVGYIVDAICYDFMFGSNFRSIKAGMAYYRAISSAQYVLANQKVATIGVVNYIGTLINAIVLGTTTVDALITKITNILANGTSEAPTFTITDPQKTSDASLTSEIKDGAISYVTYGNRGAGYVSITGYTVSGDGFAEIAQTGTVLKFLGLSRSPRPGSLITISGQSGNFLVIETTSFSAGTGAATITVSTSVSSATPLIHGNTITVFEKFSQIRLTGHDYLAIGTGNFASTAYPTVSTLNYIRANEKKSLNNGRVFYVSTDQDGNLSVGDLFQVNQATGSATLNVTSFSLTGLNSLQLQGGATVSQFSTDGTLSSNSDNIVPTQKAIRTYISSQLGSGSNNLQVNVLQAGKIYVQSNVITTYAGTNNDLVLQADGTGVVSLSDITNYQFAYADVKAQSSSAVVNKDYVDTEFRSTAHAFYLDPNGNLYYLSDIGNTNTTWDGSTYTDFFIGSRNLSMAISNTGNLQITY